LRDDVRDHAVQSDGREHETKGGETYEHATDDNEIVLRAGDDLRHG
jgi:hypothetical protein